MVDMRHSEDERKDFCTPSMEGPKYPQGLKIKLSPMDVKRLGFQSAPELGKMIKLFAHAEVVEVEKNDAESMEGKDFSIELQIKDLELKTEPKQDKPVSTVLYGE